MTKEQALITKITKVFCGKEKILLKHYVLGKILNLNFPGKKLAIEGHKDIKKN